MALQLSATVVMDISGYISDLLYEHDCVIIPGFGGFICNYQPAQIDRKFNTISPPSKAISFNVNLQVNDGLLVNYISAANNVTFDRALDIVTTWSNSSKSLLRSNDELILRNIGKFFLDNEESLQFIPDNAVNYLKSSYGLKTITAIPIYREKKTVTHEPVVRKMPVNRNFWKIAATIFLIASIATLARLMWAGVEIKPLNLNEACVFNFITHINSEPEMKPIPVEVAVAPVTVVDTSIKSQTTVATQLPKTNENIPASVQTNAHGYYIIIGAFVENKNIEAAKERLLKKFPASVILIEKSNRLTRIGYAAGTDLNNATAALQIAQSEDSSIWMLRK